MGEKGNDLDRGMAVVTAAATTATEPSIIEKVTTTTTQTIVSAGEDVAGKIRDKAIDHGSTAVVDGARERLARRRSPGGGDELEGDTTVDGPAGDGDESASQH